MIELPTIAVIIIGLYLLSSIKILAEYERGVIFRLWSTLSMILVSFGPAAIRCCGHLSPSRIARLFVFCARTVTGSARIFWLR